MQTLIKFCNPNEIQITSITAYDASNNALNASYAVNGNTFTYPSGTITNTLISKNTKYLTYVFITQTPIVRFTLSSSVSTGTIPVFINEKSFIYDLSTNTLSKNDPIDYNLSVYANTCKFLTNSPNLTSYYLNNANYNTAQIVNYDGLSNISFGSPSLSLSGGLSYQLNGYITKGLKYLPDVPVDAVDFITGTKYSTVTDLNGYFNIWYVNNSPYHISSYYLGYGRGLVLSPVISQQTYNSYVDFSLNIIF